MATTTIRLPDFKRTAWASETARAAWEPRIRAASAALLDVEIASVREGIRQAALQFTPTVADLRRLDASGLRYRSVTPGRCAIARDAETVDAFVEAYRGRDDSTVGALLGFPACCRAFFDKLWNVDGLRDTTLRMAGDPSAALRGCNILGRWFGVRHVPHLPCSWQCEATADFARRLRSLWPSDVVSTIDTVLSWPVRYSALHAIAIITFPIMKMVTETDYTAREAIIEVQGTAYPAEASRGLVFPFAPPPHAAIPTPVLFVDPREWTDNGFQSRATMDAAHERLLAVVRAERPQTVLDLGCGNGVLLDKIRALGVRVVEGVEMEEEKVRRGRRAGRAITHGRIQDLPTMKVGQQVRFDLALVSENRFTEMTADSLAAVGNWLEEHVGRLAVYSYDVDKPVVVREMPWPLTAS